MFTGIISDIAMINSSQSEDGGLTITLQKPVDWKDLKEGESILTDGVCLTVTDITEDSYSCHLMPESLHRTTFGSKQPVRVNLERAMLATDRLGGHLVQGHIDDTGTVSQIKKGNDFRLYITFDPKHKALVVNKGSITINGISLTVAEIKDSELAVSLIPYTLKHTTLGDLAVGDKVNLEFDLIAKHIHKMLGTYAKR